MPKFCSVFGCKNVFITKNISSHRFPDAKLFPKLYAKWVGNVNKNSPVTFVPTKASRVCSDHFIEEMLQHYGEKTTLVPNAVPTIFQTSQVPVVKGEKVGNGRDMIQEGLNAVEFKGMFKDSYPLVTETVVNEVECITLSSQVETEDNTESVSITGRKRKCPEDILIEKSKQVSTCAKKVCVENFEHDHTYSLKSPGRLKRQVDELAHKATALKRRVRLSQQKNRRLHKKVESLKSVVSDLKANKYISVDCAAILESTFSGVPREIMKRLVTKKKKNPGAFPPELRSFALTLKFYSTKAYNYVRKAFDLGLPHPAVIRSWYRSIDGEPGFTKDSLAALKAKVLDAKRDGEEVVCALMLDEMDIRSHIEWDGKRFRGFVDLGTGIHDDGLPLANDALVFMAVSLTSNWKVPLGYFLVNGLTGQEKANLTTTCLEKLYDIGVKVVSFTCDGPASHLSMLKILGALLEPDNLHPYFPHPCDPSVRIYVFLDACHMIKLVRNTLGEWGALKNKEGKMIKWEYLENLSALQELEGLHLANKLRKAHIDWKTQKMKVNLAVQALSSSVADALEYCKDKLRIPEFQECGATVQFCRIFDRAFDILNSRNPLAKNYKAPIRRSNYGYIKKFLDEAKEYIGSLRCPDGLPILDSGKHTAFLGFLICMESATLLADELLNGENPALKYLLTYKLSQDHLELFFCAVRGGGGWNNNPTTRHFIACYKQLLMRHNIEGGHGNCTAQDDTHILSSLGDQCDIASAQTGITDVTIARRYDLELRNPVAVDHDYCDVSNAIELSEYKEAAISYIAGYVAKMVLKKTNCTQCKGALTTSKDVIPDLFVTWKTNGGLQLPSLGLLKICKETEKCILRMLKSTGGGLPGRTGIPDAIATTVLSVCVESGVFKELDEHMFDTTAGNNHIFALIKCCCKSYITIRMHHLSKQANARIHGKKIRKQFSKLVLFKHQ